MTTREYQLTYQILKFLTDKSASGHTKDMQDVLDHVQGNEKEIKLLINAAVRLGLVLQSQPTKGARYVTSKEGRRHANLLQAKVG